MLDILLVLICMIPSGCKRVNVMYVVHRVLARFKTRQAGVKVLELLLLNY